jgi:hypothetical protein
MYVYEGDKIKLTEKDFNKLLNMFQNINLRAELDILDMELTEEKKYWMPMMAKLRYRNNNAPKVNQFQGRGQVAHLNQSTRDMSIDQMLNDDSWAK